MTNFGLPALFFFRSACPAGLSDSRDLLCEYFNKLIKVGTINTTAGGSQRGVPCCEVNFGLSAVRRAQNDLPSFEHDGRCLGRKARATRCSEQEPLAVVLGSRVTNNLRGEAADDAGGAVSAEIGSVIAIDVTKRKGHVAFAGLPSLRADDVRGEPP